MNKLTKREVLNLQENDNTDYYVKLSRLTDPGPQLIYDGLAKLSVQRTPKQKKLPERLTGITTKGIVWAEGGWEDVCDDGSVVVEDYQLEIFKIV